jgi:hypothetical protein
MLLAEMHINVNFITGPSLDEKICMYDFLSNLLEVSVPEGTNVSEIDSVKPVSKYGFFIGINESHREALRQSFISAINQSTK